MRVNDLFMWQVLGIEVGIQEGREERREAQAAVDWNLESIVDFTQFPPSFCWHPLFSHHQSRLANPLQQFHLLLSFLAFSQNCLLGMIISLLCTLAWLINLSCWVCLSFWWQERCMCLFVSPNESVNDWIPSNLRDRFWGRTNFS